MKLEIQKTRETPLLSRKRVTGMLTYQGVTPSRGQIQEAISKQLDVKRDLIVVKHIYARFGQERSKVIAHVYDNEKDRDNFEPEYLKEKHAKIVKKEQEAKEKEAAAKKEAEEAAKSAADAEKAEAEKPAEEGAAEASAE